MESKICRSYHAPNAGTSATRLLIRQAVADSSNLPLAKGRKEINSCILVLVPGGIAACALVHHGSGGIPPVLIPAHMAFARSIARFHFDDDNSLPNARL